MGPPQDSSYLQSQQFESGDHHRTVPIYNHNRSNLETTTGQFLSTITTDRIWRPPQDSSYLQSQQIESGDHHRTVPIYNHNSSNLETTTGQFLSTITTARIWRPPQDSSYLQAATDPDCCGCR